ncbi:MAG: tripartite tricarboxylate transporter TctB family protein [Acidobacteriota bacterium]|nr:tripartite tricarboxylate transporter TctB family protein [Acidobacteriota bacterium]
MLQRLAAAELDTPPRDTLSVTPTTVPTVTVAIFGLLTAALAVARARDRTPAVAGGPAMRMAAMLALALLLQPVVMMAAGFIISSTLLFVVTATAWRGVRPLTTVIARDAIVGAVFTTLIYFIFSAGLGVSLP